MKTAKNTGTKLANSYVLVTKEEVVQTAIPVFFQKGSVNTTLLDLAMEMGTDIATLNKYFSSVDDIYNDVIATIIGGNELDALSVIKNKGRLK